MTESQQTEHAAGCGCAYAQIFGAALLRDAHAWTRLQCELLSGVEALWDECIRRQNEAVATSARLLHRLYEGSTAVELAQIQRDWLAGAARRTAATVEQWAGESGAVLRETAASAGAAMAAANESARQAAPTQSAAE